MIELFHCTSPNVIKVLVALEEMGLDYRAISIDISRGEHLSADYQRICPNAKLPAIRDLDPPDGGDPFELFESAAILQYLAEKCGRFQPTDLRGRYEAAKWLFWQMANLGPISGQNRHFRRYGPRLRPEVNFDYGVERYTAETNRLYGVLDRLLAAREYMIGDYSIADMATYPWVVLGDELGQDLADFPNIARWFAAIKQRPAVVRAYKRNADIAEAAYGLDEGSNRASYPWEGVARHLFFNTARVHAPSETD